MEKPSSSEITALEVTAPSQIVALTREACHLTQVAVAEATNSLAKGSRESFQAVKEAEEKLDFLDREIDKSVTATITTVSPDQACELLACMKLMIDLERIGDLTLSFTVRAEAVRDRLEMEDVSQLIKMGSILEKMLGDILQAFLNRDLECAVGVLRADSEIDRLRNLLVIAHLEHASGPESIQVIFMAQALERAGDHAKNLAEEICHLLSGHSVRHLLMARNKPYEQMFLEHLRTHYATKATLSERPQNRM
jgi:phosphate transport system protein